MVRGDICDRDALERAFGEYEADTVFHLAAQTIVGIANRSPVSTFESNIRGAWNLLEACRRSPRVKSIVAASSDKAYGDQEVLPYSEDAPLRGRHPYDVSKSCADLIAQTYAHTYGLPVAVTLCGNFHGGGDLNWNHIVPGTIRSVLRGERPVIRSNGHFVRDHFYGKMAPQPTCCFPKRLHQQPELSGQAFNFSVESEVTVIDLVNRIMRAMGSDLKPVVLNEASNEIRSQFLSAAHARETLDWAPLFTLDEGLARTIDWYEEFLGCGVAELVI